MPHICNTRRCLQLAVLYLIALCASGPTVKAGVAEQEGPYVEGLTEQEEQYAWTYYNYFVSKRVVNTHYDGQHKNTSAGHADATQVNLQYQFMLPLVERLAGISYMGHAARLRLLLERVRAGEAVRVGALGGSITWGQGVGGWRATYGAWFTEWLNAALPPTHAPHPDLSLLWTYRHVYDTYRDGDAGTNTDKDGEGEGQGQGGQGEGRGEAGADAQGHADTRREVLEQQQRGQLQHRQQQQQQNQVPQRYTGAAVQGQGRGQPMGQVQGRAQGDQRVGCQGGWFGWLLRALRLSGWRGRGRGQGVGCQDPGWGDGEEVAGQGRGQGQQQQQEGRWRRLDEDQGVAVESGGQGSGVGQAAAAGGAKGGGGAGAGGQQGREELGGGQGGRVGEDGVGKEGKEHGAPVGTGPRMPAPPRSPPGPPQHRFVNGAVPGTQSAYMSSCLQHHLPPDVDLVLLEYAVNDAPTPTMHWRDDNRRAFERLVRKLLRLPSRPAVVLVNMFAWQSAGGRFWMNAERDFNEVALYYGLPSVSLEAAVVPSAAVNATPEVALGAVFNGGKHHPGRGGHVAVTELLITLSQELLHSTRRLGHTLHVWPEGVGGHSGVATRQAAQVAAAAAAAAAAASREAAGARQGSRSGGGGNVGERGGHDDDDGGDDGARADADVDVELRHVVALLEGVAARPLPPPLATDNWESGNATCFLGHDLRALAVPPVSPGWNWTDEGRNKWGWVAMEPGQLLRIKVNTLVRRDGPEHGDSKVVVQVAYLQSYTHMGQAALRCAAGCSCGPSTIDAWSARRVSVTSMHQVRVSQHPQCVLELETLGPHGDGSAGGGKPQPHDDDAAFRGSKFKLLGVVIGEEPGARHSGVTWLRQTSFDMAGLVHEAEQQQLRHSGARAHGVADGAGGGGGRGRQHRGTARGQQ